MSFYFDKSRDLLLYPQSTLFAHVTNKLEGAKPVNGEWVAVPRNLHNSQTLRYFNYPTPPIMTEYDWPIKRGWKPLPHQKLMANFMVLHPRCYNLSDMGSMKTMATLWASDWLMRQYPPGEFRCLIVCPLSTMQRVWGDAIFTNFFGKRTFEVLHGSQEKRLEALNRPADFYIINFDGVGVGAHVRRRFELDGFSKTLAARSDIRLAVVDEASAFKVATTKRHRIARLVFGQKDYLWLLTGTPTAHAPTDAYGLAKLVNNSYGKSFTTFQAETMIKVSQFKWVPQKDGYEKAGRLLQPSIRFALEDVWDGPEMTTQQRQVALTSQQTKLLSDLKNSLQVTLKSGKQITAMNEAAARQKALQIILGGVYDEDHKTHVVDVDPRLREIKDLIEEAPGKLLIFAEFRSIVELLNRELKKLTTVGMVHGDIDAKDRSVLFQNFQLSEHPRVLCAHPGTMAHGLDLWRAQTVIWYGPVDSTEIYLQANRRAYRPGQKFPVSIVQLVATKLERGIFQRLETNESMQGVLLDLIKRNEL